MRQIKLSMNFPIDPEFLPFYEFYLKITKVVWRHEEVLSSNDRSDYLAVSPEVKKLYVFMLKLLNSIDDIVGAHWEDIVPEDIRKVFIIESINLYIAYIEREHAFTYKKFITAFIEDPMEREMIFSSYSGFAPIEELLEYSNKYVTNKDFKYGLFANMLIEHILLPVIFAFVGWTAEKSIDSVRKRVAGFVQANTMVMNDEATHADFAFMLMGKYKQLLPDPNLAITITDEFMKFVYSLVSSAFEGLSLPGINADILYNVAKVQANRMFQILYDVNNRYSTGPVPGYLLTSNTVKKESNFETNATLYTRRGTSDWANTSSDIDSF